MGGSRGFELFYDRWLRTARYVSFFLSLLYPLPPILTLEPCMLYIFLIHIGFIVVDAL